MGTLGLSGKAERGSDEWTAQRFFAEILYGLNLAPSYSCREDHILPRISGKNGKHLFGKEARLAFYQALCSLARQDLILVFDQGSRIWELGKKGRELLACGQQAVSDAAETALSREARPLNGRLPTKKRGVLLVVGGDNYHVVPLDKNSLVFIFDRS